MSQTTDDAPAFLPLDYTYSLVIDTMLRVCLDAYVEISNEVAAEDGIHGDLPVITVDKVGAFLRDSCEAPEHAPPLTSGLIAALIAQKTMSLMQAQIELDLAMDTLMKGNGVTSTTALFVNDPVVTEALDRYELPEREVVFVPVADFYTNEQRPGDERRDLLMGALRWNGVYLCRPALVSLPDIEDSLIAADAYGAIQKTANVAYLPRHGMH